MPMSRGYLRVFRNSLVKCISDVKAAEADSAPGLLSAVEAELSCMLAVLDREEPDVSRQAKS